MKTPFTIIGLLFVCINVISQPVTSEGSLSPISKVDDYTMTENTADNRLNERLFTNKTTGKPAFKYSRKDDSSFVYTEFDPNGKEIRQGTISQNNSKAMHYKITKPDLEKDPELKLGLVKDSILYDDYFDRHGYWIETMLDGRTWEGNYDHELKTGIWKRIIPHAPQDGNEIDSIIVYQNNLPINGIDTISSSIGLFPLLMGNWFGDPASLGRMYQVLHRKTITLLDTDYLKFSTPQELELVSNAGANKASWSFDNNLLIVKMHGKVIKSSIVYLDGKTLIIRILSN